MCGIFAIVGKNTRNTSDAILEKAIATIALRGPDDRGIARFSNCILGHTRLAIVDLTPQGHQPMKDGAKNNTIVFNGEIYDYQALRETLTKKGHVFQTNSDTETILKAYDEYGVACPEHLDGMFAFALWDEETQELFLARDRFGKKPLYYAFDKDNTLYVASEIKTLFTLGIVGEIDEEAIDNYLTLMYIPPWKSVYKNIHTLPPAHSARFKDGVLEVTQYWKLADAPVTATYEDAKKEIKRLFDQAVRKRMVADVEIGAFLSGGVDSTLVTAYAQKYTDRPIKTFSVGYDGGGSELPYAKEASEKIGTDHYTLTASGDLLHELKNVISYFDEPHADSSNFPQHLVSGLAAKHVKVALSGDGADELFLGYGWYWKYWNTSKLAWIKNIFFSNPFKEYLKSIAIFTEDERRSLWKSSGAVNDDIIAPLVRADHRNGLKKINLFDLTTYLPGQLLSKVDQTSMMHSLEVRCPFLDYHLAEYVYNIPEAYKTDKKTGKIILKDLLSEIMPKEFVYRRKQGFNAPVQNWLEEKSVQAFVRETLGKKAHLYRFFKEASVQQLVDDFYIGNKENYYKVWSLLCLELWLATRSA